MTMKLEQELRAKLIITADPQQFAKITGVKELQYGRTHEVFAGAPCQWSLERGATHTLYCGEGFGRGTRPAKLLKTRLYVGVDEQEDRIVWHKWDIRTLWEFPLTETTT